MNPVPTFIVQTQSEQEADQPSTLVHVSLLRVVVNLGILILNSSHKSSRYLLVDCAVRG